MRIQQLPTPQLGGPANSGSVSMTPALGKGPTGATGPAGPAGPTGAPGGSDGSFAGWINDTASATRAALNSSYASKADPTFTGTVNANRLALGGVLTAKAYQPNVAFYSIAPTDMPAYTGPILDPIGHVRNTILTGDWTIRATVAITATGGTADWTIGGQTATVAWNASAATVQTALQGLSSVGAGNVTVSGGPGGTTPYVVSYAPRYVAANRLRALTVNGANLTGAGAAAALTWTNNYGPDSGYVFGENAYHVTGMNPGDGNGIAYLYGGLFEADIKSDATLGKIVGLSAEASWAGAAATGTADSITSMQVNAPAHKDGASPALGTATNVTSLAVAGATNSRTIVADTTSGNAVVTSTTGQFVASDYQKVITGPGIPAGTYITAYTATTITLSNAPTATAAGVTLTIAATAQATNAATAVFGAGSVATNGQTTITASYKDEIPLIVSGYNNGLSFLSQWKYNGQQVARIDKGGIVATSGTHIASEGLSNQATMGNIGAVNKPGIGWGSAQDAYIYRDAAAVVAVGVGMVLKTGRNTTANRPSASTVGAGSMFYDTTLSKPIWSDGAVWRDAMGTAV